MTEEKLSRKERRAARQADDDGGIADLADIIATVNRIADRLQKTLFVLDIDVTITDWLLLHALKESGAMSMSETSRRIGVSRQRVHQQAKPLVEAGLIEAGEGEARVRPLRLTDAGAEMLASLEATFSEVLAANLGTVPTQQIRNGKTNVKRIFRAMTEKKDDADDEPAQ
jgi:DNA-binding MarR family transcriptional regulator